MEKAVFFIIVFAVFTALAEPATQPEGSAVQVDFDHNAHDPFTDTGQVQDKMGELPELVEQEKFLKKIGFSDTWPTPRQVYKRVESLKAKKKKMRGLANVSLDQRAKQYEQFLNSNSWGTRKYAGNVKTARRHVASSLKLHHDTATALGGGKSTKGKKSSGKGIRRWRSQ